MSENRRGWNDRGQYSNSNSNSNSGRNNSNSYSSWGGANFNQMPETISQSYSYSGGYNDYDDEEEIYGDEQVVGENFDYAMDDMDVMFDSIPISQETDNPFADNDVLNQLRQIEDTHSDFRSQNLREETEILKNMSEEEKNLYKLIHSIIHWNGGNTSSIEIVNFSLQFLKILF